MRCLDAVIFCHPKPDPANNPQNIQHNLGKKPAPPTAEHVENHKTQMKTAHIIFGSIGLLIKDIEG